MTVDHDAKEFEEIVFPKERRLAEKKDEELTVDEICALMSRLFDYWDLDQSGRIDKNEILVNLKKYCKAREISDREEEMTEHVLHIFYEVDEKHVGSLDRTQFALFVFEFSHSVGVSVEDVVSYVMETLGEDNADGWSLMPALFELMDVNNSGSLDREEILLGLRLYCNSKRIVPNDQEILRIFSDVDLNNDYVLDAREFSVFMAKFCNSISVRMEEVASFILEHSFYAKRKAKKQAKMAEEEENDKQYSLNYREDEEPSDDDGYFCPE
jgi:Ca2+-binding EF-hand superfamily protein